MILRGVELELYKNISRQTLAYAKLSSPTYGSYLRTKGFILNMY